MNIYVGNLSYEKTEGELRSAFEQFGKVDSVSIIKDKFSGQSKGFAFVEMTNQVEAEKAMSMFNGRQMGERDIRVSLARPQEQRGGHVTFRKTHRPQRGSGKRY